MIPPQHRDPGLARERTRLAWARTAIAFAAVGAALLKKELEVGLITLAAVPLVFMAGRMAARAASPDQRSRHLLAVAITVTVVAILALIAALLVPGPDSLDQLLPRHG
jgi:uncharacterized membrane protein YidH (DUF202 family)